MADVELPPLPEPGEAMSKWAYHEYDMQDYARANVAHATAALQAEVKALREALKEAEEAMRFVYTSCATFPQEPQHIQNAAWRRIVNAVTKASAALAKENSDD